VSEERSVTQAEATTEPVTPPRAAAPAAHRHHHHPRHYRHSAASLLGASVLTRLTVVAGIAAVLWITILWALA
jgi:type VI protein secretion system component VasF